MKSCPLSAVAGAGCRDGGVVAGPLVLNSYPLNADS
jgi:hypothetical protein